MLFLPSYDSRLITLFQFGNDYVRRYIAVDVEAIDYKDIERVAIEKARLEMRVDIIILTLQDDDLLRTVIFPDAMGFKCPDLRINNVLWEVDKLFNFRKLNNLKHAIDKRSKQANHILLSHTLEYSFLYRVIKRPV